MKPLRPLRSSRCLRKLRLTGAKANRLGIGAPNGQWTFRSPVLASMNAEIASRCAPRRLRYCWWRCILTSAYNPPSEALGLAFKILTFYPSGDLKYDSVTRFPSTTPLARFPQRLLKTSSLRRRDHGHRNIDHSSTAQEQTP